MHHVVATGQPATEYLSGYLGLCGDIWGNCHCPQVPITSSTGCIHRFLFAARISTACKTVLELSSSSIIIIVTGRFYHFYSTTYKGHQMTSLLLRVRSATTLKRSYFLVWSARLSGGSCCRRRPCRRRQYLVADARRQKYEPGLINKPVVAARRL